MTSIFRFCLTIGLLTATLHCHAQNIIVNTGRPLDTAMPAERSVLEFNLNDYFAAYAAPGPIATFHFRVAKEDGVRPVNTAREFDAVGNPTGFRLPENMMTYQLTGDVSYDNLFETTAGTALHAEDLHFENLSVELQLLPQNAPQTVANFIARTRSGEFTDTIFHRNLPDTGFPGVSAVIQGGGFRIFQGERNSMGLPLFSANPGNPTVVLEYDVANAPGTIAMARPSGLPDAASSEFFFNITDNSRAFGRNFNFFDPFGYTVFGRLVNLEEGMNVLRRVNNMPLFNAAEFFGSGAFQNTPVYLPTAPRAFDEDNFARVTAIDIPEGQPAEGLQFSWQFVNLDGLSGNRDSFDVQLGNDGLLRIQRSLIGRAAIEIKATTPTGQEFIIPVRLEGFNQAVINYFPLAQLLPISESNLSVYTIAWFGNIITEFQQENGSLIDTFPWVWHGEHGWIFLQGTGGFNVIYYDATLGFVFTRPATYPWLYSFDLQRWFFYARNSGSGGVDPVQGDLRWFYDSVAEVWLQGKDL